MVVVMLLMQPLPVCAADNVTTERPRIGLVLGGGGARGAAHVGVLKVLEELRIPVDVVVGTSMGSIVGGLYAAGMSPEEIEHEMLAIDWGDAFQDSPKRQDRSYRRKRDDDLYTLDARLGVRDGEIKIPLAFIRGQKLNLLLSKLTLPVAGITDFDKLPIPYRAVAADIETGKQVVLRKGSLANAIRASMAVPAVFDPVEIDGRLLVDGGIANNVPVSIARKLGADVVIVVDVGSGLSKREDIKTGLDITFQLTNFLFTHNTERELQTIGKRDVLIRPALGEIGGGDFKQAKEAIAVGEQSAREAIANLQRYTLDTNTYSQHLVDRTQRQVAATVIDFIRIDNQSTVSDDVIAQRISAKTGMPIDIKRLEKDIAQVYGLEIFDSVRYEIVKENGKTGLVISAKERTWGPGYLQFGVSSSNNFKDESIVRFGVFYTLTQLNELNGEWRTGVQLGDEPGAFTEWHQPLDPLSRYFVSAKADYLRNDINIFDSAGNRLSKYRLNAAGIELGVGREFGNWGEGRLGYRRATGTAQVSVGAPAPELDFERGEVFLRLSDDKLDSRYFPRTGHAGSVEYRSSRESYGASADYDQWIFHYMHAFSWGQNTIITALDGSTTPDDDAPIEGLFETGGFLRLSGLQEDQLSGQHIGQLSLVYMRRLLKMQFFESYAGMSLEVGNAWQRSEDISLDNTITAGSVFLGFDTPIGPLYLGYGITDTSQESGYLYLGPRFAY